MLAVPWFLYRHRVSPHKHFLSKCRQLFSGVVDSQFPSCSHCLRDHNYALNAKPCEGLELAIRLTGMIDEPRIVTLPPLPNLSLWLSSQQILQLLFLAQSPTKDQRRDSSSLLRRLTQQAMRPLFRPSSVRKTCTGHESRALAP
jgi:hypothetical protein